LTTFIGACCGGYLFSSSLLLVFSSLFSFTHFSSLLFIALPSTARVSDFCLFRFSRSLLLRRRFDSHTVHWFFLCCAAPPLCAAPLLHHVEAAPALRLAIGNWQFAAAFFFFHGQLQFHIYTPNNVNVSLVRNVAGQKTLAVASNDYKTNAIGTVKHSTAELQW
jgi:hypothetical protein